MELIELIGEMADQKEREGLAEKIEGGTENFLAVLLGYIAREVTGNLELLKSIKQVPPY